MKIGQREIGPGHPPYVIAEIGVNHDGEVARALELTEAAAQAGADAVKLQYFETDRLLSKAAKLAAYQKAAGETDPVAMLRRLELTLDEMALVVDRAHGLGIHAIVTVFSVELVERAAALAWDAYKSASPDVINRPLLEALAATGRPLIVSTGASTLEEVVRAVGWLEGVRDWLAVLQCVSSYPCRRADAALLAVAKLSQTLEVTVGYSDHTEGLDIGALARRCGAHVLEKHLTHSVAAVGPDHRASLESGELRDYITYASRVQHDPEWMTGHYPGAGRMRWGDPSLPEPDEALGMLDKRVLDCERDVREVSRQSMTTTRAMGAGEVISPTDVTIKRPGVGIEPFRLGEIVGRTLARGVDGDMPLMQEDLEN